MTVDDFAQMIVEVSGLIAAKGFRIREGSASPEELLYLAGTAQRSGARRVAEVGFNAGFSSTAFLMADPHVDVVSFDIGVHDYVPLAKSLVDERFPGRHTLIYGDSRATVPKFARGAMAPFDLLFVDGGHEYETALCDLRNMRSLAHASSVLILDDVNPCTPAGRGPGNAWRQAITEGWIIQEQIYEDGRRVQLSTRRCKRSWARGLYRLDRLVDESSLATPLPLSRCVGPALSASVTSSFAVPVLYLILRF